MAVKRLTEAQRSGHDATVRTSEEYLELSGGETVAASCRPAKAPRWVFYLITLGLYEFWRRATVYAVTDRRVVTRRGIVTKTEGSLPLFYVQDATIQTFLGWGRMNVSTAGGESGDHRNADDPEGRRTGTSAPYLGSGPCVARGPPSRTSQRLSPQPRVPAGATTGTGSCGVTGELCTPTAPIEPLVGGQVPTVAFSGQEAPGAVALTAAARAAGLSVSSASLKTRAADRAVAIHGHPSSLERDRPPASHFAPCASTSCGR